MTEHTAERLMFATAAAGCLWVLSVFVPPILNIAGLIDFESAALVSLTIFFGGISLGLAALAVMLAWWAIRP